MWARRGWLLHWIELICMAIDKNYFTSLSVNYNSQSCKIAQRRQFSLKDHFVSTFYTPHMCLTRDLHCISVARCGGVTSV